MNSAELHGRILSAHAAGDGTLLARLYGEAGTRLLADGKVDEGCFFLTQAYAYALETGLDSATEFHRCLAEHGRER